MNLIPHIVLGYLSFKNPVIWLDESQYLTMPTLKKLIFVASVDISLHKKKTKNLIFHRVFEIFKFKKPCNLISREHFRSIKNRNFARYWVCSMNLTAMTKTFLVKTNDKSFWKMKKTLFFDHFGHFFPNMGKWKFF